MILEVAILEIKRGLKNDFEKSFFIAQKIISSMKGYVSHEHLLARLLFPRSSVGINR